MRQTGQIHRSRRAVCHPGSGKVGDMIMAKIAEVYFGTVESDGTVGASRFPRWIYIKHPRDCFGSTTVRGSVLKPACEVSNFAINFKLWTK